MSAKEFAKTSQDGIVEVTFHQNYSDEITIRADEDSWTVYVHNIITGRFTMSLGVDNPGAGIKANYNEAYERIKREYPNLPDFTFNN